MFAWEYLSKEALALQHPPKNISSHTEQKSGAKRKRNYRLHCRNRHKKEWSAWTEHRVNNTLCCKREIKMILLDII